MSKVNGALGVPSWSLAAAGGAAIIGGFVGGSSVDNREWRDQPAYKRAGRSAAGVAAGTLGFGAAALGGIYVGTGTSNTARAMRAPLTRYAKGRAKMYQGFRTIKPGKYPAAFRSTQRGTAAAIGRTFVGSPLLTAGAGAALGAYLGGEDHRGTGAAIGGAVGLVGPTMAVGMRGAWKGLGKAGKLGTAGKVGIYGLAAGAIFGIGSALSPRQPATEAWAKPDGLGGYEYGGPPQSGLHERLDLMNASGDLVLGLNNGRRG